MAKEILTLTSNQEKRTLLKLSTMKFLFAACIFEKALLSSVKKGVKTSLVLSG
jgi:hypothetical protein